MSYIISILLLLLLARVNNTISKKILYPPLYLGFIWISMITIHFLYISFSDFSPNKLRILTLFYFFLAILSFSFGGLIAKLTDNSEEKKDIKIHLSDRVLNWLVIILITTLILFVLKVKELTGDYFNMLLFRYYTSVKSVDIGLIKYAQIFSIFATMLVVLKYYNSSYLSRSIKFKIMLVILCSLILAYLSGSRGSFFLLALSVFGIYSVYRRVNVKLIAKSVTVILIVFLAMASALKKAMPNQHNSNVEYSVTQKLEYFFYSYGTLPLSAFDDFLNEPYEVLNGEILFRLPKTILFKLGVTDEPSRELVEKYSRVPDLVNVYTGFYKLIKDFGVLYSLLFMLIIGYIHSNFFLRVKKSFAAIIGFSVLLFPLTMLFFEENYVSILSTWIQLIFYTYIAKKFITITHE